MGPTPNQGYDANAASDEATRLIDVQAFVAKVKTQRQKNSEAMQEDLLMLAGEQWDPQAKRERGNKRPTPTHNLFPPLLAQITGEIRRNKPGIKCLPADGAATPEAAEVFEGIIRHIERLSMAPLVYAAVGKSVAACGEGHMRIVPVREDEEGWDTGLRIRHIKNVHSVLWDPGAQAPDKSDAERCVVFSEVDRKGFEEAYPQAGASAWDRASAPFRQLDGWRQSGEKITVAEEWVVKREPYERYRIAKTKPGMWTDPATGQPMWTDPTGEETTIDGDVRKSNAEMATIDGVPEEQYLAALTSHGFELIDRRTAYKKKICMYLWGGNKQIAGPIEWMGSRIPIFTITGEETHVGEDTVTHGVIRFAKDDQCTYNYARAAQLELVSQAPKAPIMVADQQIDGHEDTWALAQRQPVPFLPYNHVPGLPQPQERSGPSANSGPSELAQAALIGVKDTTGIQDAAVGKKTNETSGVAIEAREAQVDTGTFVYLDNVNFGLEAMGNELVVAIPHYYSAREQIAILGEDDAPAIINLEQSGIALKGKYHVICQRGPSYQSKREKAAELLMEMSRAAPPWAQPSIFMRVVKLLELPDADEFIEEIKAIGQMIGQLPPEGGAMPGMPPGMPMPGGAPPMPGGPGAPPSNVIPMPPRGGPPQGADPLAGIAPVSPPRVPAARPRVGNGPMPAVPPGM